MIEVAARTGYAARGAVYLLVGFFAVLAAFGRSEVEGTSGALQALLAQPFGAVLVGLLALGLVAIAVWRFIQGVRDTDAHGSGAKGLAIRAGLIMAGLSYTALAFFAGALLVGSRAADSGGDPTRGWLATVYEAGLGPALIYAAAAILFAVGIAHIVKAIRATFERYMHPSEEIMRWLRPLSRFGLIARGIVFLIIGGLTVAGGAAYSIEERPGLGDALRTVQEYAFGWLLLLAIGVGLAAFGLYSIAEARYREVSAS